MYISKSTSFKKKNALKFLSQNVATIKFQRTKVVLTCRSTAPRLTAGLAASTSRLFVSNFMKAAMQRLDDWKDLEGISAIQMAIFS